VLNLSWSFDPMSRACDRGSGIWGDQRSRFFLDHFKDLPDPRQRALVASCSLIRLNACFYTPLHPFTPSPVSSIILISARILGRGFALLLYFAGGSNLAKMPVHKLLDVRHTVEFQQLHVLFNPPV
jgi:hypothetical protein